MTSETNSTNISLMQESKAICESHSHFYTEIENVFTTPTTVSEASDDAKEIELEESLLSHCSDKERFLSIIYSLKDNKLEILLPFLRLLYLFKQQKNTNTVNQTEETVSDNTLTESKVSKTPSCFFDMASPKYFDWDFIGSCDGLSMEPGIPEREEEQEMILLEDVLSILVGYDGKYVKANVIRDLNDKRTFRISSHIKSSLRGLVEKILPVASDYSTIVRFINENSTFAAGKVNQALSASFLEEVIAYMNNILKLEYLKETHNLNLHMTWCALQETMNKMRIMSKIIHFINKENARGSSVLNILHRCTSNSLADAEAEKICLKLTKAACQSYFQILESWIYKGIIDDPFDEFMVVEKNDKGKGIVEWDQKYELRQKCVPSFLRHDDRLILNAGRYMYAIRQSIPKLDQIPCALIEHIQYENIELVYLNMIRRGYDFANETLLSMLEEESMICWLRTAKSFFSLEYGDVFYNIIAKCLVELEKPSKEIYVPYLQQLIEASIQNASFGELPFSSDFKVKLEKCTLMCQINSLNTQTAKVSEGQTGLEALTFVTNPPWPVCIVFHTKTLTGYQMLFRHIFYLKYVYMKLTSTRLGEHSKNIHVLKHSMTVFVQTCLSYMTVDTIQSLWDKFDNEYRCVDSVLEFIQLHNNYIYQTLMGCMLASSDVFDTLRKILGVCLKFCFKLDIGLEVHFKSCLVTLIKSASRETCWSALIKALIPTFTDIPEVVELNNLCVY